MRVKDGHFLFIFLLTILFHLINIPVLNAQYAHAQDEDGYRMWLRYEKVNDADLLEEYSSSLGAISVNDASETMRAVKNEIAVALKGLLNITIPQVDTITYRSLVVGTPSNSKIIASLDLQERLDRVGPEGFIVNKVPIAGKEIVFIAANTDIGVLYGTFRFLAMLQRHVPLENIAVESAPRVKLRTVDHWDNIDGTIERGYAGPSLWQWSSLPEYRDPRYTDYARVSASLGTNGVAVNNVNADARFISGEYIEKIAVLADIFRPYGLRVYISINYSSPVILGGLETADPLDPKVIEWWKKKTDEIYTYIPNFGGFLVKADSEGQPGPKTYGRSHAEGANMLARILRPKNGILIWRAFVYGEKQEDRVREAYDEFVPQDGTFDDNVILQVKNGPLDFMPREPFSPLFGALPKTNTMIEFQVSQEYLGHGNHLVYKGPMFTETLDADTYAKGAGSTVGRVVAGKVFDYDLTGMAAVVNPGTDRNWTRHPFMQSGWYAYGRLAWDYTLSAGDIAEEWIRMTFTNDEKIIPKIKEIMMRSSEAAIDYKVPLGLIHIGTGAHYGPEPWSERSKSFHRADTEGLGFDRSKTGSGAANQYHAPLNDIFGDIEKTPEQYLLWFHHVAWNHKMKSGNTLWEALVRKYYHGAETVRWMQKEWDALEGSIDGSRFLHVKALLEIQGRDAVRWRDACVLYFQTFSHMPIPEELERPKHDLEYYKE